MGIDIHEKAIEALQSLEREKGREGEEDMKLKGKGFHIRETGDHTDWGHYGTNPENFSQANAGCARQHEHVSRLSPPLTPIARPTYQTS